MTGPQSFFFAGLFALVFGLEEAGALTPLADWFINMAEGSIKRATMIMLWLSAFASTLLGNIPFVATMIPLIKNVENAFRRTGCYHAGMVGLVSGFMFWRKRLSNRGFGQRYRCRHGKQGRRQYQFCPFSAVGIADHGHQRRNSGDLSPFPLLLGGS